MSERVTLYTDGSCLQNPGPGGWAAILQWRDEERELSGSAPDSTNNRMELQAAIEGLLALKRPMAVDLFTDSTYVMKGVTEWMPRWKANGWRTACKEAGAEPGPLAGTGCRTGRTRHFLALGQGTCRQ
jgi:ribonuclease HI